MKKTALLFPGQGSQNIEMIKYIPHKVLIEASEILNYDLSKVIGNTEILNKTKYTQPAIFTVSYAIYKSINLVNENISYLIGHSLGEWTAAVVAGCISFQDGLRAVNVRASLMDNSSKDGMMAAVLGLSAEEVEKEILSFEDISVANYNTLSQTVISGNKSSVKEYIGSTKAKVIPLKVSGAFHSPYMSETKKAFQKSIKDLKFEKAKIPVILNSKAKPETNGLKIKNSLIDQLTKPVYFYQSIIYALNQNVNNFYEIGPSKVLTRLVKKIDSSVEIIASQDIDLEHQSINNSTNAITN